MADEVFKIILQMEGDSKSLVAELEKVNAKYVESQNLINAQQKQLQELMVREKQLIEARAKANNPTQALKLSKALEENKNKIAETTAEINKLTAAENSADRSAQKLGKDIANALSTAKVIGMKNEVKNLEKELGKSSKTGKEGTEKITNAFTELRKQLKDAKGELAEAVGSGNQAAIDAASKKVGDLKDKINDLNETTNAFASGSTLQKIGNLFKDVAANILNLDFERAQEQSEALVKTTKELTFKEGVQGVKQLGSTFVNVGKALLANPIFLIVALIGAIISKFDALRNVGGLIGAVFNGIAKVINVVITAGKDLLDFLGIIDSTKKSLEELIDQQELLIKQTEEYFNQSIARRKALNQATIQLEQARTKAVQESLLKEIKDTKASMIEKAASYEEFYESYKKLIELGIRASQLETAQTVRNIEIQVAAQNKLRELRRQTQTEINKGTEFRIKFGLEPDSQKQVRATFALQRKEAEAARLEEIRQAKIDFVDYDGGLKAKAEINRKYAQIQKNITNEMNKALVDAEKKTSLERLEINRDFFEKEINIYESSGKDTEMEVVEARERILIDYYNRRKVILEKAIAQEKKLGLDSTENRKELDAQFQNQREQFEALEKQKRVLREAAFSEEERHQLALFDLNKIYQKKISEILESQDSDRLRKEIEFQKKRLEILLQYNKEESQVIINQKNLIKELEIQEREQTLEDNRQVLLAVLDGIQQATDALFSGISQLYSARLATIDRALERQEKATSDAKEIAEKGNTELLEAEQKRLDELNAQREKFVRRQQAFAVLELIANSTIAITKAAAQGGIAAPFTITATLLALAAGIAQARSISSQAGFYDGGEYNGQGYTGDGNPRSESKGVGKKPYVYHNKEFIFNHKTTSKYIDVFREVHKGNIDLNSWKQKVEAYESIKNMPIGMSVNEQGTEILVLNEKLDQVITAIQGQHSSINIDGDGFGLYLKNIQMRNDYVRNKLAKA